MKQQYQHRFKQYIKEAEERILNRIEAGKKEMRWQQYALILANIRALIPEALEGREQEEVLFEMLSGRSHAPVEAHFPEKVLDYKFEGAFIDIVRSNRQPHIFCTYHLGSYRAILGALTRLGYDFSLVIDKNVFETQNDVIRSTIENARKAFGSTSSFDMINAEDFGSAMQMAKQLRNGRSLVIYLDGNTGTGGVFRHDDKLLRVNFFQAQLFARQGISYLSYVTQTPIVPVIAYRELDIDVVLRFYEPIYPLAGQSKKDYCQETIQELYQILEENLRKHPLQWEGWLYVHKYFDIDDLSAKLLRQYEQAIQPEQKPTKLIFNQRRFSLFRHGDDCMLFDGMTFLTYVISEEEFSFLRSFHKEYGDAALAVVTADQETIDDLIEKQVLTYNAN